MNYKKIINEKGLKQKFIAGKIGITPAMMSQFICGKKNLSPENKKKLHNVLEID